MINLTRLGSRAVSEFKLSVPARLFWAALFGAMNRYGRHRVADGVAGTVPVNLTTYGRRVGQVHLAIESIGFGRVRPSELILWLTEEDMHDLPPQLKRLQQRGLSIRACEDFGPHKKYYPFARQSDTPTAFVTSDDDVFYPRRWLTALVAAAQESPRQVVAWRAHEMSLDDRGIQAYGLWGHRLSQEPSPRCFPTGVGGVYYPAEMCRLIAEQGEGFLTHTPKADDVYLHHLAIHRGLRIRQVGAKRVDFAVVPKTQAITLGASNVAAGGNDLQVRASYDEGCVELLWADGR